MKRFFLIGRRFRFANPFSIGIFFSLLAFHTSDATDYYSRASGNWNQTATWSTVGCGGAQASAVPGAGDNVTICSGNTVDNGANRTVNSLTIDGTLNFTNARTISVTADLVMNGGTITGSGTGTVNVAGAFTMSGSNTIGRCNLNITGATTVSSTLNLNNTTGVKTFTDFIITSTGIFISTASEDITVNGNFQNNGTFTINSGRVTFDGATSNTVTGTSATAFNTITVNKGTSVANEIDIQSAITMTAGGLTMTNGTFKLSSSSNITPFTTALADIIPVNAGFWHNGSGTVDMPISVQYSGTLRISSGTMNVGNAADERIIAVNGATQLIVEGGTLNIAGRISRGVATDYITFTMSGGTIVVPTISSTSNTFAPIMMDQTGSTFTMTGGTLILQREGGTGAADLGMIANAGTVGISGGVIQFGDASTPAGQTMRMDCIFNIANLTVNSANATCLLADNLTVLQAVTINSGTLNLNNFNINVGGLWTNNATLIPGIGIVSFNGTGTQTITKAGGETFYNLTVNKPSGTVSLANDVTVSNALAMTQGNINVNSNTLTLGTNIALPGSLFYTTGTIFGCFSRWCNVTATPYLFPIGTSSYYRPAQITFNALTGGTLTTCFVSTDPGSNGLPLSEGGRTIANQFTEGYWALTAANGLSSTNYDIECTGNGFTSYTIGAATRLLYRTSSSNPWTLNGTHVNASGNTARRSAVSGATAQFCFGKPVCSSYAATKINGDTTRCTNDAGVSYWVDNSNTANTYTWTITGGSIASGQLTPTVTVNWGAVAMPNANVQVIEQNDCAEDNSAINRNVWLNPITTSTITGSTTVAQNETGVPYSVTSTPEYTYTWSLPSGGGTIVSGQGTATVTIDWGGTAGNYTVQVTTTRLCGAPDVQTLTVQVYATIQSATNGSWATGTTWVGGIVPTVNDFVEIQSIHTVTMNGNPGTCRKLTINGTAQWTAATTTNVGDKGIVINSTGNITGTAAGILTSSGGLELNSNWNISSSTVTIRLQTNPQSIVSTGTAGALNRLDITTTVTNTGTVTIGTGGTLSGSGTFTQGANSVLNMNGSTFSVTGFNASASGNTVEYGSAGAQTVRAVTYNNLTLSGNGVKTLGGAITVNGNINVGSATTLDASTSNYALTVGGNWSNSGDFNERFGTVTFNGSSSQSIVNSSGETFNNLVFSGSGSKQINNNITINFDFSNGSPFSAGANNISIRGNWDNSGNYSSSGNTVSFTSNTTVLGPSSTNFNNVIITATLTGHSSNFNVNGSWTNNGTFVHNSGTITFTGGAQSIGGSSATTFNHLTLSGSGTKTLGTTLNTAGNLTVNSALDVSASSYPVNVGGNWVNNGTFTQQNGTVTFNGTSAQTIGGTTAANNFYNLTQNNASGVSLAQHQNLLNVLTISAGTFNNPSYNFVLKSTASNTARIAAIPSGADFAGNIIMERNTNNPSGNNTDWRQLSSSVSGATIADWDDDFATSGFTGATCGPADCELPGCSATCNWPSIYWYDETVGGTYDFGYVAATGVTNPLVVGRGYFVYLGPNPITFEVTGTPNKFSQPYSLSYNVSAGPSDDGWNLVSNNYPCALDWRNLANWTKTNIDSAIYIWNSSSGSYAYYAAGIGLNGGSRYIASQQAFWVKANAVGPSLSTIEDAKVSSGSGANPTYLRNQPAVNVSKIPMAFQDFPIPLNTNTNPNSILLTVSGGTVSDDEAYIGFLQGATNDFDSQYDAYKLASSLNISSVTTTNIDLAINNLPPLTADVSIPIRLTVPVNGTYTIRRDSVLMLPMSSCIILEDLLMSSFIDLRQNISYTFAQNTSVTSPRFVIHIYTPISKQTVNVSCYGGNNGMAIAAGTGAGPWNYVWTDSLGNILQTTPNSTTSDSLFNLSAGTYFVTVSSNVCGSVTDTFIVNEPAAIQVTGNFVSVSCNGLSDGWAEVSVTGGNSSYSYQWSNGATTSAISNLPEGDYSVTITDANGCTASLSASVGAPVVAEFYTNLDTLYISQNDTAVFTNISEGASSYQWNFGDGSPTDTATHPVHFYSSPGTYTVMLVATDSVCVDTAYYVLVVHNAFAVSENNSSPSNFNVAYAQDGVYLLFSLEERTDVNISVYNVLGEKMFGLNNLSVKEERIKLPLQEHAAGIYFATAKMNDAVISKKFVILSK